MIVSYLTQNTVCLHIKDGLCCSYWLICCDSMEFSYYEFSLPVMITVYVLDVITPLSPFASLVFLLYTINYGRA